MTNVTSVSFFSTAFAVEPNCLDELGVLDVTLNVDTSLFIDPMLLPNSRHSEISDGASTSFRDFFVRIIHLLAECKEPEDTYWRSAERQLSLPEANWTCLGYGADKVAGRSFGKIIRKRLLQTALDIVRLGVRRPELFPAMSLFEGGMGADRISDMTTRIIARDLVAFNQRILQTLEIKTDEHVLMHGYTASVATNPISGKPLILVPTDVLRVLPLAKDWTGALDCAEQNQNLRDDVNLYIGDIWAVKAEEVHERMREALLQSQQAFDTWLRVLDALQKKPYDFSADPEGAFAWKRAVARLSTEDPPSISHSSPIDLTSAISVVETIIAHFQRQIEIRRWSTDLYEPGGKPRKEKCAQRMFFAMAESYCEANGLDITPEADSGAGPVDFKFSYGYDLRILVEVKLSTNTSAVEGFSKQIVAYAEAEDAKASFYLLIDVGQMGKKGERLVQLKNQSKIIEKKSPALIFIDGNVRPSASKL